MDFIDKLRELAVRIPKLQQDGLVKTEEGAKNALVMPFIQALGYDVFNPLEVTPELIADVGTKKGEKVDYAIVKDGKPVILFECKGFGVDLNNVHASQLFRYFTTTSVRFGVLTNGIVYRFFSDLVATNKMDELAFFTFDLLNFNDSQVETLKRFSKSSFDEAATVNIASDLKYRSTIRDYAETLFNDPSDQFVKMVVKESKAYEGVVTQTVIAQFSVIIKDVLRNYVSDQVDKRLKTALASGTEKTTATVDVTAEPPAEVAPENKIITTQDELDAYFAIKGIVREVIDVKRIALRDTQSYCNILIDANKLKPLCRLYFNSKQKYIILLTPDKKEEKVLVNNADDIYQYADKLNATAAYYANHAKE